MEAGKINELDMVRVVRLEGGPTRPVDGTPGAVRQPAIGDTGTVVASLEAGGVRKYIVECVDDAGMTAWLGDFGEGEIERWSPEPG